MQDRKTPAGDRTSTKPPEQAPPRGSDDHRYQPFTASMRVAASIGLSPRWVQYSGVSTAACKVAEALTDLVMMHTRGDQRPTLDREFLAYIAGLSRADKLSPYLRELQDIGFLAVFDGGVDPGTGKRQQRRDRGGRPLPDHFEIALDPPTSYVGPRNLTEVHAQFVVDRDSVYRAVEKTGKTPRVGRHAIPRSVVGRLEPPQVAAVPGFGGQATSAVPRIGGQVEFPQVAAVPRIRGPLIDRSISSLREEREEIDSTEPVPGGAAVPPATGLDEARRVEVERLVLRLPWTRWAEARGAGVELNRGQLDELVVVISEGMAETGMTLTEAGDIASRALAEAETNPVAYLVGAKRGALRPPQLRRRLRALRKVELAPASEQLPFPELLSTASTASTGSAPAPSAAPVVSREEMFPACAVCRAECGEQEHYRQVEVEIDGVKRERDCVCNPRRPEHPLHQALMALRSGA